MMDRWWICGRRKYESADLCGIESKTNEGDDSFVTTVTLNRIWI